MSKIIYQILNSIKNEKYVLIKIPQGFPKKFKKGSDLDILCSDIQSLIRKFYAVINKFLDIKKNSEVNLLNMSKNHFQIDFLINKKLLFKLDIFNNLQNFKELNDSSKLFKKILDNRKTLIINQASKNFRIFVPKDEDDTFIRYLEFIKSGKKKKQHEKFFLKFIQDKKLKNMFKYYVSKKKLDMITLVDIVKKYKSQVSYYKYKFKKHSVSELMNLLIKKYKER